jgi:hypothetical protein
VRLHPFDRKPTPITTAPELAAIRVTYTLINRTRTDRLAMHTDGNWYTYTLLDNRWALTTTHGTYPVRADRALNVEKASWALELHAEEFYGTTLVNIERD